jgi:hypothetical protein
MTFFIRSGAPRYQPQLQARAHAHSDLAKAA